MILACGAWLPISEHPHTRSTTRADLLRITIPADQGRKVYPSFWNP